MLQRLRAIEHRETDYPIEPLLLQRWSPRAMSADAITDDEMMTLFEAARAVQPSLDPKILANWVAGEYLRASNEGAGEPDPTEFAHLVAAVAGGEINGATGKALFAELCAGPLDIRAAIVERGLLQISDDAALEAIAAEVLAASPQALADWRAGKQQALGFLVGQAMKASKGRGNPARLGEIMRRLLDAR